LPEAAVAPTVGSASAEGAARLAAAGVENPKLDSQLLLAEATGLSRERMLMDRDQALDPETVARFDALVARRAAREPVAYILGRRDFRRLTLAVDQRVLIPRPETELLVEAGLSLPTGARVLDVGTGSGAVALALKDERPDLEVWGVDLSASALEVAGANRRVLGLDVMFLDADLLDGVPGRFDAVLANLPYVEDGAAVEPEISLFEPREALWAGPDGLDLIRRLVASLPGDLPVVALEVGAGQAAAVASLLRRAGFARIELLRDLAGIERVVLGRR
jgi:release factor glutamine methyltransferase